MFGMFRLIFSNWQKDQLVLELYLFVKVCGWGGVGLINGIVKMYLIRNIRVDFVYLTLPQCPMGKTAPGYGLQLPLSLVIFKPMTKSCFKRGPIYTLLKIIFDCFKARNRTGDEWELLGTNFRDQRGSHWGTWDGPTDTYLGTALGDQLGTHWGPILRSSGDQGAHIGPTGDLLAWTY